MNNFVAVPNTVNLVGGSINTAQNNISGNIYYRDFSGYNSSGNNITMTKTAAVSCLTNNIITGNICKSLNENLSNLEIPNGMAQKDTNITIPYPSWIKAQWSKITNSNPGFRVN